MKGIYSLFILAVMTALVISVQDTAYLTLNSSTQGTLINLAQNTSDIVVSANISGVVSSFFIHLYPVVSSTVLICGQGYSYDNGNVRINITTQANSTCTQNLTVNLTATDVPTTYNNGGISFTCNVQKRNSNITIDFGGAYTESYTNTTVNAPVFPRVNQNRVLEWGQYATAAETDSRFNYTFSCRYFNNQTLIDAQAKTTEIQNKYSACSDDNTRIKADSLALVSQIATLTQQYNSTSTEFAAYKAKSIPTGSFACNSTMIAMCADKVAPMCTEGERLNGLFGDCLTRLTKESNDTINSLTVDKNDCNDKLTACSDNKKNQEDFQNTWLIILAGFAGLFGVAFLAAMYMKRKKVREEED